MSSSPAAGCPFHAAGLLTVAAAAATPGEADALLWIGAHAPDLTEWKASHTWVGYAWHGIVSADRYRPRGVPRPVYDALTGHTLTGLAKKWYATPADAYVALMRAFAGRVPWYRARLLRRAGVDAK